MTITPQQLVDLAVAYGPIVLSAVGTLLLGCLSGLAAIARWAWKAHQRRMLNMAEAMSRLAEAVETSQKKVETEHKDIWAAIQGLRAELQLANRNTDTMKTGLLKAEGAMEQQRLTIKDYIRATDNLSGKMEAVFRFIDAPPRATDSKGG